MVLIITSLMRKPLSPYISHFHILFCAAYSSHFVHFATALPVFFPLIYENLKNIYFRYMSFVSKMHANNCSHSAAFFFILLTMSFDEQSF